MAKSMKKHYKKSKRHARKHMKTVVKHKSHKHKSHKNKSNKNKSNKNKKHSLKHMKHAHKKRISFSASRGRHKGLRGGNCGCSGNSMIGGMVSSPASGPVGYSWNGGNPASWPGVASNNVTMSNHLKASPNGIAVGGVDPYSGSTQMSGGKYRKNKKNKQKGGFFQEILNLGRGAQYGLNSGYYNLVGKEQPISQNPYPTQDQPIDTDYKFIGTPPPNVRHLYANANNQVAKI
jgi:hypothetical protein